MSRQYKIEGMEWTPTDAKHTDDLVMLTYERSPEDWEATPQKRIEIFAKSDEGLDLVMEYETGIFGGSWTSSYFPHKKALEKHGFVMKDNRGKERVGYRPRTGTKGNIYSVYVKDDGIEVAHRYHTGTWSVVRSWTISKQEGE